MDFVIHRGASDQALYKQILEQFRKQIQSGELALGTRLDPEMEIARTHQVSRTTVRQALGVLVKEGLLDRVPGRGTFVRNPTPAPGAAIRDQEKRIGIVLTHVGDQLNMEILIGVELAAKSRGYQISFTYSQEDVTHQRRDFDRLRADHVGGLIVFPISNLASDPAVADLHTSGLPVVLVDRYFPALPIDYVVADNYHGGYRATEHLIILGHTRIGFVHRRIGDLTTTSVRDRWRGYRQALVDYGLTYDEKLVSVHPNSERDTGDTFFDDLLLQRNRPSAYFLVTDQAAPAFLQAARRQRIGVPGDVAVVGFDDLSFAGHLNPPLTTVAQPRTEIGIRAGHLLIDRIEGQAGPARHVVLPTSLIVRDSCGARLSVKRALGSK